MERYIFAMSKSRVDVAADLEQGCDELILHLIKLRMYPAASEVNHWRKEVAEKLHRTDTFKGSHKLPSVRFILQHTYDVHESRLDRYIHIIDVDYNDRFDSEIFDKGALKSDIHDYFEWLANELATSGRVAYADIYVYLSNHEF